MNNDIHAALAERAAYQVNEDAARSYNLKALADLASTADSAQQAAHMRGIVATTMAHLTADATAATRDIAVQWETWALGLIEALVKA